MAIRIGLDVGSTSVKLAATLDPVSAAPLKNRLNGTSSFRLIENEATTPGARLPGAVLVSEYRRAMGNPFRAATELLQELRAGREIHLD